MKPFLIASVALAATVPIIGQTDRPAPPTPPVIARPFDLNVLVLDKLHHPETGLASSDFLVYEDDKPRAIQSVSDADGPISLCLVIDESGSTYAMRQPIGDAAVALVKGLPQGSEVMVVRFSDAAYLDLHFTSATSVTSEQLTKLTSRGGTAMFDALVAAGDYVLANAHQKRRALVLISDGGDNESRLSEEQAIQRLLLPGAPVIYSLSFPDMRHPAFDNSLDTHRLKILCKLVGGVALSAKNPIDMPHLVEEISAMISGQYVLSFMPADNARDGKLHKLEVRITSADKHQEIHALTGYNARDPNLESNAK